MHVRGQVWKYQTQRVYKPQIIYKQPAPDYGSSSVLPMSYFGVGYDKNIFEVVWISSILNFR